MRQSKYSLFLKVTGFGPRVVKVGPRNQCQIKGSSSHVKGNDGKGASYHTTFVLYFLIKTKLCAKLDRVRIQGWPHTSPIITRKVGRWVGKNIIIIIQCASVYLQPCSLSSSIPILTSGQKFATKSTFKQDLDEKCYFIESCAL